MLAAPISAFSRIDFDKKPSIILAMLIIAHKSYLVSSEQ